MEKQFLLLLFLSLVFAIQAQVSKTINIATAGTLSTQLTSDEKGIITNLTVTGTIDARDVECMRDQVTNLAVLDLSAVTIVVYKGTYETYPANEMPEYSFHNRSTDRGKSTLTSIILPNSIISIGIGAFKYCNGLTNIKIGNSVNLIRYVAFQDCTSLTTITIPNSVTSIEAAAFYNCTSLTEFIVDTNNPTYSAQNGVLFNKNETKLIQYPPKKRGIYTIPPSVTSIGANAFANCTSLTNLTIGRSVISIGNFAFEDCAGLTNIAIPNSVTSIGVFAFWNCTSLTTIYSLNLVPPMVGNYCFKSDTSVTAVYVPASAVAAYESAPGWKELPMIKAL